MATMHDLIVYYLNLEARRRLDWLPEIPEDVGEENTTRFSDADLARKQLRLLANSAVEVLRVRVEDENRFADFRHALQRVRRMNSQASASAGTSRLLRIYDYQVEERGENSGGDYYSAAMLANLLLDSYNGWGVSGSYEDAADHYSTVVGPTGQVSGRQGLVLKLLADLKKLDEDSA